jgi:hypothetical protein
VTHPHTPPDPSPHDGRFLAAFALTFVALAALCAALVILVDPLGRFGTGWLPPVVTVDRDQKAALYRRLARPPATVVLGSSRSKTLAPGCLTEAPAEAGFNFAVNGAATEDLVAILRFLEAQPGFAVRSIVAGIDPEMLQGSGGLDRALAASRALGRYAPVAAAPPGPDALAADLFGWQSVSAAVRSLAARGRPVAAADAVLDADGRQRYSGAEALLARASAGTQPAVLASIPGILARYESFPSLDSTRAGYLRLFLTEARAAGVAVTVFIPPVHPAFARAASGTAWRARTEETVRLLRAMERDGLARYVETRTLLDSRADTLAFVDAIHFASPAAAVLAGALTGHPERCAFQ